MDSFLSIKENTLAKSEILINKSQFLGFAKYIDSAEDANNFLNDLRIKYKDARHICYAYRLRNVSKASDDGEPSGTAGKPMLQVLEKQNLANVIVAVVRYFGGIKLGAGGLLRAYTNAVTQCLENAQKVIWYPAFIYKINMDYKDYQPFLNKIKGKNIEIFDTNFDNGVELKFFAREDEFIENATRLEAVMHSFTEVENE